MAKVKSKGYKTDTLMGRVYAALVSDLSTGAGLIDHRYARINEVVRRCEAKDDYRELRELTLAMPEPDFEGKAWEFKARYQIKNYLKRYIFSNDLYSTEELETLTNAKFVELQTQLSAPRAPYKVQTELVLKRARRIVKDVLGTFDPIEHGNSCRFSTKACVGFPTSRSYLHDKTNEMPSGSYGHLRWFTTQRIIDKHLDDAFYYKDRDLLPQGGENGPFGEVVIDALDLINVPKSFKILRGMSPNTLLGSYHSYGLGAMIAERLKKVGIDISRQPELHKKVAKRESARNRRILVTADLSNASTCYTSVLVRKLVPYEWYRHLNLGRLSQINIAGRRHYMASFMAMGIGFTFPLQTLLFYAIIKATQELLGKKGFISVFGDDLIYHRRIHPYVVSILTDCGFTLNMDKTFVQSSFRESCGGDYFDTRDVRPANPEGVGSVLGKWKYLSFLHKIINGLTFRWSEHDLPSTIHLLKRELLSVGGPIFSIPDDLPDYAGVKRITCNWYEPFRQPVFDRGYQAYLFTCLVEVPHKIPVPTLIAYYWDKLRSMGSGEDERPSSLWRTVRDTIDWIPAPASKQPKNYRSRITRRRLKLLIPHTAEKGGRSTTIKVHQAISILAS